MATTSARSSALYLAGVRECAAAGCELTPEQYAEILDAARGAIDPGPAVSELLQLPVTVGSVVLWPVTIGASMWWQEFGQRFFERESPSDQVLAVAWMLAHARRPEIFSRATTRREACKLVRSWIWGRVRGCTVKEIEAAVEKCLGERQADTDSAVDGSAVSGAEWGDYIAGLCAGFHRPPEYFLWACSAKFVAELAQRLPSPLGEIARKSNSEGFHRYRRTIDRIKADAKSAPEEVAS